MYKINFDNVMYNLSKNDADVLLVIIDLSFNKNNFNLRCDEDLKLNSFILKKIDNIYCPIMFNSSEFDEEVIIKYLNFIIHDKIKKINYSNIGVMILSNKEIYIIPDYLNNTIFNFAILSTNINLINRCLNIPSLYLNNQNKEISNRDTMIYLLQDYNDIDEPQFINNVISWIKTICTDMLRVKPPVIRKVRSDDVSCKTIDLERKNKNSLDSKGIEIKLI